MLAKLAFFLGCISLASASAPFDAEAVCKTLHSTYPDHLLWDPDGPHGKEISLDALQYRTTVFEYWNAVNAENHPTCAFLPSNASQVSTAVKLLSDHPDAHFAIKGGGHQFNAGFSSTNGGVLLSFNENLAAVSRSEDGQSFHVGAGARWGDVYDFASKTNQVVVGGRLANIGVAGLTLGGGLSYYSAQYGLACDNVLNFEVVLPNGTIANANHTSNPDLWWALKGGGNRFAVVTQFTLRAHPLGVDGQVWGGIRLYKPDDHDVVFHYLSKFIRDYPDAKAAIIPTFDFGHPGPFVASPGFFYFYDGPSPPPNAFAGLETVDALLDTTNTTTYHDITNQALGAKAYGIKGAARVSTFPNLPPAQMKDLFQAHWDAFLDYTKNDTSKNLNIQLTTFTPQPLSVRIANASAAAGGNALGLDPDFGDRIWVENDMIWIDPVCNEACPQHLRHLGDNVTSHFNNHYKGMRPSNYVSGDVDFIANNPLFMNDAAYYQDVYSSYGSSNKAKLQRVAKAYDPEGFMGRQGGWELW